MCRKGYAVLFSIVLSTTVCGQAYYLTDTVEIGEVTITARSSASIAASRRSDTIRNSILATQGHKSLGQILSGSAPFYIKSYGPGGISSVSLRGSGPGHTLVTWNGITVNNSMLGQCDLSLIPAGIANEIRINYGASSMPESSGGIGGSVDLASQPVWENSTKPTLYAGAGSFGHYQAGASIKAGSDRLESSTAFYLDNSKNDFPYVNRTYGSAPVRERHLNSETAYMGFLQNLYYRKKGSVLSARLWYQDSERNLPGSLLAGNTFRSEQQVDVSLRSLISYEKSGTGGKTSFTAAYTNERLSYSNKQAAIESRNNASSFFLRGKAEYFPGRATTVTVLLNEELNHVVSNNYDGIKKRSTTSMSLAASRDFAGRLGASLLIRETYTEGSLLHPDFSGTLRYKASEAGNIFLSTSISRNSKLPSMNDLYWYPGGNPSLRNEYAYQYEAGADFYSTIAGEYDLGADINCF
ncbi:MAG: TonB-dependent receptor, partial [Bacteroidales bacterium]|nr:TonB-dependent receptor [Bacteroidales bacterium]